MFLSFFICCSWIITAFYAFYMVSFRFRGNTMAFRLLWAWGWGWVEVVVGDGCFCKFQHIFGMIFPQNNRFMVSELSCFLLHTPSTSRLHCWKSPLVPPNKAPRHIFSAAHWWLHARSLRRWDNHFLSRTNYLVGGFNPSKKLVSWDYDSQYMEKSKNVPNHQPVVYFFGGPTPRHFFGGVKRISGINPLMVPISLTLVESCWIPVFHWLNPLNPQSGVISPADDFQDLSRLPRVSDGCLHCVAWPRSSDTRFRREGRCFDMGFADFFDMGAAVIWRDSQMVP